MAANRYGRIYHGSDYHYNNLRFPSVAARREFAEKFEKFHAQYEHDGEPPRYEDVTAATIGNMDINRVHNAGSVSIDGYMPYEIYEYHNDDNQQRHHYRPPTTIAPPVIVIERNGKFIDASTLTRHELSAIFMDMPDEDFQHLLKSVERDGFKDPVIRLIGEQVLDGWHRFRAAKELNLLRKLRFKQWDKEKEGSPEAFVYARNMERRHLNPGQRAQIAVSFNERYGHGGDRSKVSNDTLKTQKELAKEANVGVATIKRASQVEKTGRADEVISGEKTAGEVITEETIKSLWEQINPAISEWKKARDGVGHASKTMLIKATLRWEGLESHAVADVKVLRELLYLLTTTETDVLEILIRKLLDGKDLWADDEEELAKRRQLALDAEQRMFDALDEVAPDWDYDDFIKAACDKHSDWGVSGFPDLDETEIPTIWEERYDLLTKEIKEPAPWIQQMLDKMAEPTETEPEPAEDREKVKELKQKKQVAKALWDKRIQAGRDYLGKGDSDLNQHLTLADLEKGFIKGNPTYADDFQLALRLTSKTDFPLMWEKAAQCSLDDLEKYQRAMAMYASDLLQWQRPDWSPDTNWILPLIEAKKAKAEDETEPEPDKEGLSQEFKRLFTLHSRCDRDLLDCEALSETYHIDVDDVQSMMQDFQRELGSLEVAVRKQIKSDAEMSVEDIASRVEVDDIQVVKTMLAKIQIDDESDMNALWEAFSRRVPKWKAKYAESGYKENDLVQGATEAELFDALRSYRHSDRTGEATAEEIEDITDLMKKQSYPLAFHLRKLLRGDKPSDDEIETSPLVSKVGSEVSPKPEGCEDTFASNDDEGLSDVDRCYAENHLRVLQNTLSPLLQRFGADDMTHHDKEVLTADLYDVFLRYENVPTEKEMIIALLGVVEGILSEEISEQ